MSYQAETSTLIVDPELTDADGTVKNFIRQTPSDASSEPGVWRVMDCIDCHNRAAHYVPSPQEAVDMAIADGLLPADIPYLRAKAIEVLSPSYSSEVEAHEAIDGLVDFYRVSSPKLVSADSSPIFLRIESRPL